MKPAFFRDYCSRYFLRKVLIFFLKHFLKQFFASCGGVTRRGKGACAPGAKFCEKKEKTRNILQETRPLLNLFATWRKNFRTLSFNFSEFQYKNFRGRNIWACPRAPYTLVTSLGHHGKECQGNGTNCHTAKNYEKVKLHAKLTVLQLLKTMDAGSEIVNLNNLETWQFVQMPSLKLA